MGRCGSVTQDSTANRFDTGLQPDDGPGLTKIVSGRLVQNRPTPCGDDQSITSQQLQQNFPFQPPKLRLAIGGEDLADRASGDVFQLNIGIDPGEIQS